ncbi:Rieske (2Fe-2S) protein [Oceanobacter antarcticus]|jgi:nitrite reductase/ring-hydroxylating ferredoxin subunit|uniref:Rieske 2Fe-2S domain-containing protein n=1 Tax=Oceanobacter antarcticus TaxID=3133425 RepID=A0ABW8NNB1_9GAMM
MNTKPHLWVCHNNQLTEGGYQLVDVIYANEPSSVVIFRHQGTCLAYRNLCVHMPRRLDCEKDMIFDRSGKNLRCSMHGIIYDPVSGESISAICNGEKLTPVKVLENDDGVWITDKRVKPIAETGS